jgi:xylulokinase
LLGIDIGSSVTKAVAFATDGTVLAHAAEAVPGTHPQPGWWEIDAAAVLDATWRVIAAVASDPALVSDPPTALALSASGRESVPVAADGRILGPMLRTADARAAGLRAGPDAATPPVRWIERCGHVPDHMDPLNRWLWWREEHPAVVAETAQWLGWHELVTRELTGRAVVDHALAGKFFAYDLARRDWSDELLAAWSVDRSTLPAIAPFGTPLGTLAPGRAAALGLPVGVVIGTGSLDTSCGALGGGAATSGVVGLAVGSWESFVEPVDAAPPAALLAAGRLAVGPHPGVSGLGVFALSPNGTVALDRIRDLTGLGLAELAAGLERCDDGPGPVLAIPHLSGATNPWPDGDRSQGALLGLSLATSPLDVARAVMEGIAFDLALTLEHLRAAGAPARLIRAGGGGARSAWWMQLKADLTGLEVEVVDHPEAGALGAAIGAGLADGTFAGLEPAVAAIVRPGRRYTPDPDRAARYGERLVRYRATVEALIDLQPTRR